MQLSPQLMARNPHQNLIHHSSQIGVERIYSIVISVLLMMTGLMSPEHASTLLNSLMPSFIYLLAKNSYSYSYTIFS